jgi:hypothetical protein
MTADRTNELLGELRDDQLRRLLAVFVHELTIAARDTYEVGGVGLSRPEAMREYNEIVHRLAAALRHIEEGDRHTAIAMLRGQLPADATDELSQAVDRAFQRSVAAIGTATASR